jgi:hypothetical protein
MGKPVRSRRIVALIAAYVVALQALLLPLSVAAGSPFINSLCASAAGTTQQKPISHQTGCPCAAGCGMQCCAQGLAGAPQVAVAPAMSQSYVLVAAPVLAPAVLTSERGPQIPRAPPAA